MQKRIHDNPLTQFFALVFIVLLTATLRPIHIAARQGISDAEQSAISHLTTESIRRFTTDLSAPAMEGRGTAQPGGDRAARYIADQYKALGLKPLGDRTTFFQPVRFHTAEVLAESRVTMGRNVLTSGKDFVITSPLPKQPVDLTAALVFVAYGVVSPQLNRDDLANIDIRGKVAMIITGKPRAVDEAVWRKSTAMPSVISALGSRGAVAVLIAADSGSYGSISDRFGRRSVSLAEARESTNPPAIVLNHPAAERMLEGAGSNLADLKTRAEAGGSTSREITDHVTISLRVKHEQGTSNNVVGVIEGSDTKLKEEAVVFSAHYDAYGIAADGRIYPGAADNALGVAEMLAIAEAVSRSKASLRRSLIFIAVTGEEYGLLGSKYWVEHPTWPIARIAANINYDGVGTETFGQVKQVAGFGAEFSDLGKTFINAARDTAVETIPDPVPEQRIFYRSDHYSFAAVGIPAINILGGPGGDTKVWIARLFSQLPTTYHQPGDVIGSDWNWDGPRTVAMIGLLIGLRVANADAMPNWLPTAPFKRSSQ
jgi:hypothetical protein